MSARRVMSVVACLVMLSLAGRAGAEPGQAVGCGEAIAILGSALPDRRVLSDRLALPLEQDVQSLSYAPASLRLPYFAKFGIQVRGGREPVDVLVPRGWRRRLAIVWGTRGERPASRLRFLGCEASDQWRVFPGGVYVRRSACVPLLVHVGDRRTRVQLSIGRACRDER